MTAIHAIRGTIAAVLQVFTVRPSVSAFQQTFTAGTSPITNPARTMRSIDSVEEHERRDRLEPRLEITQRSPEPSRLQVQTDAEAQVGTGITEHGTMASRGASDAALPERRARPGPGMEGWQNG